LCSRVSHFLRTEVAAISIYVIEKTINHYS
jgi:hypothetical protein